MATIKFSELSAAASLASTAYFPGVQNGQNIRATIPVLAAAIAPTSDGTPLNQTAATAVIPLNLAGRHMADYTITAPVEFTIASSPAPVNGGDCVVAVIASGATANIPTYGSLIYQEGSWNNATARVNLLNFSRIGSRNFVEIKPTQITADYVAPTLASASIPTAGTTLVLTYNENLLTTGDGVPDAGDFSISAATATTVSSATVSGAAVTLTLSRTVNSGETVTLGYAGGVSGRIQDTSGNLAAGLNAQAVTNNSTQGNTDPYWANVELLLINGAYSTDTAANGTDGFLDQTGGHTVTKIGTPLYSSASAPSGLSTSLDLDGSTDALEITSGPALAIGTDTDFAIDFWVRAESVASGGTLIDFWGTAGSSDAQFYFNGSGQVYRYFGSMSATLTENQWHHIAIAQVGNNATGKCRFYLDGTKTVEFDTGGRNWTADKICIGRSHNADGYMDGKIAAVRFTLGNNRGWTGTTITVPPLPLPNS